MNYHHMQAGTSRFAVPEKQMSMVTHHRHFAYFSFPIIYLRAGGNLYRAFEFPTHIALLSVDYDKGYNGQTVAFSIRNTY